MNDQNQPRDLLSCPARDPAGGFTLVELMIAIAVIAILASVAIPAYNSYTLRTRLAEGMTTLSDLRLQMEQYFQDNRSFAIAGTTRCAIPSPAGNDFSFSCKAPTPTTFVWTATSKGGALGASSFIYTIDQNGNRKTLAFDGTTSSSTCWEIRPGKCS